MIKTPVHHSVAHPVSACPFCDYQPYKWATACVKCNCTSGTQHIKIRILEGVEEFEDLQESYP